MPEMTVELVMFLVCVGSFTLAAAISDYRYRKIPNKLTLPVFVLGLGYQLIARQWDGLADAGLGFLIGFGALFILFAIGGGGGGDGDGEGERGSTRASESTLST